MRSTMRDGSIKCVPTRATSRRKHTFGFGYTRQDSLSHARPPLTHTPSSHDAPLAAQKALLRLDMPSSVTFIPQYCRPSSPTDAPSISTIHDMQRSMRRHGSRLREQNPIEHDVESIHMDPLTSVGPNSECSTSDTPMLTRDQAKQFASQYPGRPKGFTDKLKGNFTEAFTEAFTGYKAVWRQRKEYVSDEHVAVRAIFNLATQPRNNERSMPPAQIDDPCTGFTFQSQVTAFGKNRHVPASVAWPIGDPTPMYRAPTPSPVAHEEKWLPRPQPPPLPPIANYGNRQASVLSARTGVTQWGDIQDAVNRESFIQPPIPESRDYAASSSKGKGEAQDKFTKPNLIIQAKNFPFSKPRPKPILVKQDHTSKCSTVLNFQPLNNGSLVPEPDFSNLDLRDRRFDSNRQSWMSDAAHGYRAHTDASSIYSRPAPDEPRISPYQPPPIIQIPDQYARTTNTKTTAISCPVSPLSTDAPVSVFFSPWYHITTLGNQ